MITDGDRIERVNEALAAGFTTKSGQKDALDTLNRVYSSYRKLIHSAQIAQLRSDAAGDDDVYYASLREMVDLPFDLHQYRDHKHAVCFADNTSAHKDVLRLVELRETVKTAPVNKPQSKAAREAIIREKSEINQIAAEFDKLKPGIRNDYINQVRNGFDKLVNQFNNDWVKIDTLGMSSCYYGGLWRFVRDHTCSTTRNYRGPQEIDEDRLETKAVQYADDQIAAFVHKLSLKLVDLTNVELRNVRPYSFEFVLAGMLNGKSVEVFQTIKYGTSKLGNPYVQWPALIYVEGDRVSEKKFKEMASG